jgi:imidazoleglycerol phosphate synthase glutamine amidotransferase subunit HisH
MKDKSVLIPDFGIGNLPSIIRIVEKVGGSCSVSQDPEELLGADKIIIAGVGALIMGSLAVFLPLPVISGNNRIVSSRSQGFAARVGNSRDFLKGMNKWIV